MWTKIISLIAIALLLLSCDNNSTETISSDDNNNSKIEVLELNNGKKWTVNEKMLIPIHHMEKKITDFATAEKKDYKTLAEYLKKETNSLVASCNMRGKGHDELHKWLVPYMDFIKKMKTAENETEAEKQFKNIQASFVTYNQHFE